MPSILNPYINFGNTARDAITFYHSVLGGELMISSFADFGAPVEPDEANLVMHSQLSSPNGMVIMAADTPSHMERSEGTSISVSLSGDDEAELRGYWDGLSAGGTIAQPLEKAPWGDTFGMFTDKFGINWLFNIAAAQA